MKTVVVTGASGVIGSALLPALAGCRVVCLAHRQRVDGTAASWLQGDLRRPRLGLSERDYRRLVRRADAIVHCAAVTDFTADAQTITELNVRGTEAVLELAAAGGVPLYYVSTAFVARSAQARPDSGTHSYLESKRTAEQRVRASGLPAAIIRPSVVIGDSASGEIARFQGLHALAGGVMRSQLPFIPLPAHARVDFLPQDVVASGIAELVHRGVASGEWWLTAGHHALSVEHIVEACRALGGELGRDLVVPRLFAPDAVDRLIRPVFIDPLPKAARLRVDQLVEMTALFDDEEPFPSSAGELGIQLSTTDLRVAFVRSMRYWAMRKGLVPEQPIAA